MVIAKFVQVLEGGGGGGDLELTVMVIVHLVQIPWGAIPPNYGPVSNPYSIQ